MDIETRQAYSEVNKFLEVIGEEMSNKIPLKLRNFFKREMDKNYIPTININTPIKEQKLKRKTIAIIAGLNLQYWCKEERKKELLEIYYNNEKKYQDELHKKYNPDNIFKNSIKNTEKDMSLANNMQLSVVKRNKWYKILFEKIMKIFSKRR